MRSFVRALALAAVCVSGSAALRYVLDPMLEHEAPMLPFLLAVVVASLAGGYGAGLAAIFLSLLAGTFLFIEPRGSFRTADAVEWARLSLFTAEGIAIAWLGGRVLRTREALAREVERRTGELERSNAALQTFVHTMSHDLRAPLRAMTGFSEALEEHAAALPPSGQHDLQRIGDAARRADRLVESLLLFARLNAEALGDLQPVSLDDVVDQACGLLRHEIAGTSAIVDIRRPLGMVAAHPDAAAHLVLNLLSNALKFVRPGTTPRVVVSATARAGARRLRVEDNGIGIAAEDRARIFRPFERLHARSVYGGSGLGLSIVAASAARMGGRVGVESDGVSGSCFWVELDEPRA